MGHKNIHSNYIDTRQLTLSMNSLPHLLERNSITNTTCNCISLSKQQEALEK